MRPVRLQDVWGISASDVWAVGSNGTILHYNGTTSWSNIPSSFTGATQQLSGLWGNSASDVWAVGASGTIFHYNGTGWSSVATGNPRPHRRLGHFRVRRVGCGCQTILHYNGTSVVERRERDDQRTFRASGAVPPLTCGLAVGAGGTLLHGTPGG